jgi:RNA-splicing ligase RtcB
MITMKGKYNFANIMIDQIDDSTRDQIQEFLNHPAFGNTYIAIMPDCHAGAGAVIGFTMKMNNYIIPNVVGVDIGCGMLAANFGNVDIDPQKIDNFIKKNIPSGFGINSEYKHVRLDQIEEITESCYRIETDSEKALKAIGSLGGGNHFIEIGVDSKNNTWVTIHSGSRNFGLKVANYYQKKAKNILEKYFIKDQYKNLEFLLADSKDGEMYLKDLRVAQKFASSNRFEIMSRIKNFIEVAPNNIVESVHNFIGEDNIIRKGATPARLGETVIIPFNMRDGIAICEGKGNSKFNYSAPHGAGRILSRKQARMKLSVDSFQRDMIDSGIFTTTANIETLDEAPGAYKDMNIIIENIEETVSVIDMIKPIYNFKSA